MDQSLQNVQISRFALNVPYEAIGPDNIDQLKRHLLDAIGSMISAITAPAIKKLVKAFEACGDAGRCKVPLAGKISFDKAAQLYTALIRYPDFMDNFLGKEATCHPSDNIGALLAASQFEDTSGKEFLLSMAIAYQIQCRLVEEIPVMKEGIDHTLLLGYSLSASLARMLKLTEEQTAHALGISGCSLSPLAVSRASYTYEWKGFASSMDALDCMNFVLLAGQGMTGPVALFEGPKGFKETFNMKLDYDWHKENFELIKKCILKIYNAEVHSQSAIDAIIELRNQHAFEIADIEKINITTFLTAYHIIGSGAYGDRKKVDTKEQADHSFHYLAAVALLDGEIYPAQFEPGRIKRQDVQELLQKVFVDTGFPLHKPVSVAGMIDPYTAAYPQKMKAKVEIILKDGKNFTCKREDYPGFFTRPLGWDQVIAKFKRLCLGIIDEDHQQKIIDTVRDLDNQPMTKLLDLLVSPQPTA